MKSSEIACSVSSPLQPYTLPRIFLAVGTLVVIAAFVFGGYTLYDRVLRSKSQIEFMSEKVDGVEYFREPRTQLCFQLQMEHGIAAQVACGEVRTLLNPKLDWLAKHVWYFQDMRAGVCYAMVRHPHYSNGEPTPVPCYAVSKFFDTISADLRWRYEDQRHSF